MDQKCMTLVYHCLVGQLLTHSFIRQLSAKLQPCLPSLQDVKTDDP